MGNNPDTICAISTPLGRGAISLIRVSGENSIPLVSKVFTGSKKPKEVKGGSIIHGWIQDPDRKEKIDEVLLFVFRKPKSYTGEDLVEISTHGGTVIPMKVLHLLLKQGARLAEPGEFTRRSFLNDKMSLLEAEALLNVIQSKTERGARLAERNLDGRLQEEISGIKSDLLEVKTLLEATLDFDESDGLQIESKEIFDKIQKLNKRLKTLASSYDGGRILMDGIRFAIVGKPNVGKSSLFNTILHEDRAIVTRDPGTTRDTIEGTVDIDGYPVSFMDMAGIRSPLSEVERIGVERALEMAHSSDGILFVLDGSEPIIEADKRIYETILGKPFITVVNKCDLPKKVESTPFPGEPVFVSAKERTGIDKLNDAIINLIQEILPDGFGEGIVCTTERQRDEIKKAIRLLNQSLEVISKGRDLELVAFNVNEAIDRLKELTGEITQEDVLDQIFSRFCIGK